MTEQHWKEKEHFFDEETKESMIQNHPNASPYFSGFDRVSAINDDQGSHPTCFPESVENILQLYYGDISGNYNHLSTNILEYAKEIGAVMLTPAGEYAIPNAHHQTILSLYGVPTELCDVDHQYFKHQLDQQCPIQLGVDSAYLGNLSSGPHSITLVDLQLSADGRWFYRVLDSANPHQEWYPASVIEDAARSAQLKWPDGYNGHALVCKRPAMNWPYRT